MARVIHFDILVKEIDRAIAFYRSAFGWTIDKWDGPMDYWLVGTGDDSQPGIDGGIAIGEPNMPDGELTLGVDSLDETVASVKSAGGSVVRERGAIPGVGWLAMVKDTEGNAFGLMESDPDAK